MAKAGRKPIDPSQRRVTLAVRVRPDTRSELEFMANAAQISMGEAVDTAVEMAVAKAKAKPRRKR